MIAVSYPWPELDLAQTDMVQPNAYVFAQIGRVFQYLVDDHNKETIEMTIGTYYPLIERLVVQILEVYNDDTSKLLNEFLTMLEYNIHLNLPQYLRNLENISRWLNYVKIILEVQLPQTQKGDNCNSYMQNKIISSRILLLILSNHANPNSDGKKWTGWAKTFVVTYAPNLFQMVINTLFSKK